MKLLTVITAIAAIAFGTVACATQSEDEGSFTYRSVAQGDMVADAVAH